MIVEIPKRDGRRGKQLRGNGVDQKNAFHLEHNREDRVCRDRACRSMVGQDKVGYNMTEHGMV